MNSLAQCCCFGEVSDASIFLQQPTRSSEPSAALPALALDADALMQMEPDLVDRMEADLRVGDVPLEDFVVPPPQGMVWLSESPSASPVRSVDGGSSHSDAAPPIEDTGSLDFLQAFLVPPPPKSLPVSPMSSPRSSRSSSPLRSEDPESVVPVVLMEGAKLNESQSSNC